MSVKFNSRKKKGQGKEEEQEQEQQEQKVKEGEEEEEEKNKNKKDLWREVTGLGEGWSLQCHKNINLSINLDFKGPTRNS